MTTAVWTAPAGGTARVGRLGPNRALAPRGGVRSARLTPRGWRAAGVLALIVAVGLVAAGFQLGAATVGERLVPTQSVVVTSGDTLWSIARDQLGQAGGDDKVRDLVLEIDQINGLASSELVVGQVLEVPRR